MNKWRYRAYELLESRIFVAFIYILIILNTVAIILESIHDLHLEYGFFFFAFEFFSVVVFTIEYLLRIWTCSYDPRYSGAFRGRIKFILSPLGIIDLLAIAPFYLPFIIRIDLRFLRILRLVRMVRIFKLGRYSKSLKTLGEVLRKKKEDLLVTVVAILTLLIIASCIMFVVESEAQPDTFPNIPSTMWWAIVTLTTVGYGDIYPITITGRVIASIIALLGIGLFALPAGILGSGFVEEMQSRKASNRRICPHCGEQLCQ